MDEYKYFISYERFQHFSGMKGSIFTFFNAVGGFTINIDCELGCRYHHVVSGLFIGYVEFESIIL